MKFTFLFIICAPTDVLFNNQRMSAQLKYILWTPQHPSYINQSATISAVCAKTKLRGVVEHLAWGCTTVPPHLPTPTAVAQSAPLVQDGSPGVNENEGVSKE